MEWIEYKEKFFNKAKLSGISEKKIDSLLKYANNLFNKNLPIIFNLEHFSLLVGFNEIYLLKASNCPKLFYRSFDIPKKSSSVRTINEPLPNLKEIQKWILDNILNKVIVSKFAKAYVLGNNLKDNARFHRRQKTVLKIDIEKFFDNIDFLKTFNCFKVIGYNKPVSALLANLCTLNNSLPQGSPTSPAISNIVFKKIDNRISGFTRKHKIRYTRYADDLTFSGDFNPGMTINFVKKIIEEDNYRINFEKIRVMKTHQRQIITGIVVNHYMQTSKKYRKKIRQELYYIKKFGLSSHLEKTHELRSNYLNHLLGKVNFVTFVDPKNDEFKSYYKYLINILKNDKF